MKSQPTKKLKRKDVQNYMDLTERLPPELQKKVASYHPPYQKIPAYLPKEHVMHARLSYAKEINKVKKDIRETKAVIGRFERSITRTLQSIEQGGQTPTIIASRKNIISTEQRLIRQEKHKLGMFERRLQELLHQKEDEL